MIVFQLQIEFPKTDVDQLLGNTSLPYTPWFVTVPITVPESPHFDPSSPEYIRHSCPERKFVHLGTELNARNETRSVPLHVFLLRLTLKNNSSSRPTHQNSAKPQISPDWTFLFISVEFSQHCDCALVRLRHKKHWVRARKTSRVDLNDLLCLPPNQLKISAGVLKKIQWYDSDCVWQFGSLVGCKDTTAFSSTSWYKMRPISI